MTERTDRKLREVPVATYSDRHEAEFAAGVLDEAGVPYRMQLDDPSMGMSIGMSATIWVRSLDVDRAREVLEHGVNPIEHDEVEPAQAPAPVPERTAPPAGSGVASPARATGAAGAPLTVRERGLLLLGSGALVAPALFLAGALHPILLAALSVGAVLLAVSGLVGRGPEFLRRLVRAIAGEAP